MAIITYTNPFRAFVIGASVEGRIEWDCAGSPQCDKFSAEQARCVKVGLGKTLLTKLIWLRIDRERGNTNQEVNTSEKKKKKNTRLTWPSTAEPRDVKVHCVVLWKGSEEKDLRQLISFYV